MSNTEQYIKLKVYPSKYLHYVDQLLEDQLLVFIRICLYLFLSGGHFIREHIYLGIPTSQEVRNKVQQKRNCQIAWYVSNLFIEPMDRLDNIRVYITTVMNTDYSFLFDAKVVYCPLLRVGFKTYFCTHLFVLLASVWRCGDEYVNSPRKASNSRTQRNA